MKKTANTVSYGDKLYHPITEKIEEIPIFEIRKSNNGIEIGTAKFGIKIGDSLHNAAISTEVKFHNQRNHRYFLNIEDAQKYQRQQLEYRLKYLQGKAIESLNILNEFTLKYFTNG